MHIEYNWEDWREPSRKKRVWRRALGIVGLVLYWMVVSTAVCVTLLGFTFGIVGLTANLGAGLLILLLTAALTLFVVTVVPPGIIFRKIPFHIILWSRCLAAVAVIE